MRSIGRCAPTCTCTIAAPFRRRNRAKPLHLRQKYILDGSKAYVVGCAVYSSPNYDTIIDTLYEKLEAGTITCKSEAHRMMQHIIAREKADADRT